MQNSSFISGHHAAIHDVCFNFYGRRLATCSSDHTIKIWDIDENGEWKVKSGCDWMAHHGPVWKVSWAHPEFGQVLASCSSDHTVKIWEEQDESFGQSRWNLRATFQDSKQTIHDVEFHPSRESLQVACCSADGIIRIYEAKDIMNLEEWVLEASFRGDEPDSGILTLSWNPSRFERSMLAVGTTNGTTKIFQQQGSNWTEVFLMDSHQGLVRSICWAPNMGRSFHLIASVGADRLVKVYKFRKGESPIRIEEIATLECGNIEVWKVRWNCTGTLLACSCGDGEVILWKCDSQGQWKRVNQNRDIMILGNSMHR